MSNLVCHRIVSIAIRHGFLAPAYEHDCVDCGQQATVYDHRDYNKPLEVEPVCRACNKRRGAAVEFKPVESNGRQPPQPQPHEIVNPAFVKAVEFFGGVEKLERASLIHRDEIRLCGGNKKKLSLRNAIRIEYATKGAVTREQLRPDIFGDTAA